MLQKYRLYILIVILLLSVFSTKIYADTGSSQYYSVSVGGTIFPTTVVFEGYTSPKSIVYIEQNKILLTTALSNSSGYFNTSIINISQGIEQYSIYSQDQNNINSSTFTVYDNILGDRINIISNINLSPTFKITSNNNVLNITGFATPLSSVEIFINGIQKYTLNVNSQGEWSTDINNLETNKYIFSAIDITPTGILSNTSLSETINFILVNNNKNNSPVINQPIIQPIEVSPNTNSVKIPPIKTINKTKPPTIHKKSINIKKNNYPINKVVNKKPFFVLPKIDGKVVVKTAIISASIYLILIIFIFLI